MSGELVAIYTINIQVYTHLYIGQKRRVHTNFYKSTENYIIYSVKTIATLFSNYSKFQHHHDTLPINHA